MDKNLSISIVVPVYNQGKFLRNTVNSVLNQTYQNWELLIIDDGSTDDTLNICMYLATKDLRIRVFTQPNAGQGAARNKGIKEAKYNFIAFLDSDDSWDKQKLIKQINIFVEKPSVDLVFSPGRVLNEKGNEIELRIWKTGFLKGANWINELFERSGIINSSVMVRRECLNHYQFDESNQVRGSEDWDLWLRLALARYTFYGTEELLVTYFEHQEGIHLNKVRMFKGKTYVYQKYEGHSDISKFRKLKQNRYVYRELMNYLAENNKKEDIPETFNQLSKKDKLGLTTTVQRILFHVLPVSSFLFLSNKILYRIGYRVERIYYSFRERIKA